MITTRQTLDEANYRVTLQLRAVGLYCSGMASIVTRLVPFGLDAYGWKYRGREGEINIPALSLARWPEWFGQSRVSLRDVLRHEFGHALMDLHPGLFRSRTFRDAFGSSVGAQHGWHHDPEHHITPYAATNPEEDFCETFMVWLKWNGRLPLFRYPVGVQRKLQFVNTLSTRLSRPPGGIDVPENCFTTAS